MCVCLLKYTCKQKCFSKDIQKTDNTGLVACGEKKRVALGSREERRFHTVDTYTFQIL